LRNVLMALLEQPDATLHDVLRVMSDRHFRRSSIMLAFFTMLYREYCRARLAEMRKYQLTHPGGGN